MLKRNQGKKYKGKDDERSFKLSCYVESEVKNKQKKK